MNPWTALVEAIIRAIGASAEMLGGNVLAGVFLLTLLVRLLMVPILIPLARKTRTWRQVHGGLKPEIKSISHQYKDDPGAMQRELKALHRSHGIGQVDGAGLLGALIQVPVLIAFFQAVIEMSDGTALASGGLLWGFLAGGLSWAGTTLGDDSTPKALVWISGLLPIAIAAWLGSGVGIYLVAFYLGTLVQSLVMRRRGPAGAAASGG